MSIEGDTRSILLKDLLEKFETDVGTRSLSHARRTTQRIRNHLPGLLEQDLAGLTISSIDAAIDDVEQATGENIAHDVGSALKSVLRYATSRHLVPADPTKAWKPPLRQLRRGLSLREVAEYWPAFEAEGHPYGHYFQILFATGLSSLKVSKIRIEHINAERRILTLAGQTAEPLRVVALSNLTLNIIEQRPRHLGGDYLFQSTASRGPITGGEHALNKLRKITGNRKLMLKDLNSYCRNVFRPKLRNPIMKGCSIDDPILEDIRQGVEFVALGLMGNLGRTDYKPSIGPEQNAIVQLSDDL